SCCAWRRLRWPARRVEQRARSSIAASIRTWASSTPTCLARKARRSTSVLAKQTPWRWPSWNAFATRSTRVPRNAWSTSGGSPGRRNSSPPSCGATRGTDTTARKRLVTGRMPTRLRPMRRFGRIRHDTRRPGVRHHSAERRALPTSCPGRDCRAKRPPLCPALRVPREVLQYRQQRSPCRRDVPGSHASHRNAIDLLGQWHQSTLERSPFFGQEDGNLAAVPGRAPSRDIAEALHGLERGERRGLHHAGLPADLALSQSVVLPEDAQEGPMAEGDAVCREAGLERADQCASRVLDEMRHPVVGHC